MKTVKIDKYYKGMVAHRGLSGIETENTVFSFLAAANHSYHGISADLYTSKDGYLILTSQTSLLKYGLLNLDIQSFDYEELVKYTLVDRKTGNLNKFLYIPLLRDYLPICKSYEKKAMIRIHPSLKNYDLDRMLKEINEIGYLKECVFIIKEQKQINHLLESVESHQIYYDHLQSTPNYEYCNKLKINAFLSHDSLGKEYVKKFHLIGLKVMTGVVNDKENAEKMIKLDIDHIMTEILE